MKKAPTYWTTTVSPMAAEAPVPTTRSLPVSTVGAGGEPAETVGSWLKSDAPPTAGTGPTVNSLELDADDDE